jgi:uncharacterized membrane protein YedE/YeeE
MTPIRDIAQADPQAWLAIGGLALGVALGALLWRTGFCTMGALSDVLNVGDWRRFRAWCLAIAVAIAGTQILNHTRIVALDKSIYLAPSLNWAGHIIGGLLFGLGMVFAGGCTTRNITRAGGGDVRSMVVLLVVGLTAYMTIGGILAPVRAAIETAASLQLSLRTQSVGDVVALALGSDRALGNALVAAAIAVGLLAFSLGSADFRRSPRHVASGIGLGLAVVAGWALTGVAFDELAVRPMAPASVTFVRPVGDTLEWLARYTAAPMPSFGVTSVLGMLLGAGLTAVGEGRFRLVTFADLGDTLHCLAGAALMGIGGAMALGCTIGQGVTGLSTLALGSFMTFAAIVAGGLCGLKLLERSVGGA